MKNIAVIGCGRWGKNLVRNFYELGNLKMICDRSSDALKSLSAQYSSLEVCNDPLRVLGSEDISAVAIATPAETHYELARKALLAGKDVFVEKPLALRVHEADQLVSLAEERDLILMVGHLLEYHQAVLKLRELVSGGSLGDIHYIYSHRLNLGRVRTEENILWSFAPHDISVLLMLLEEMPSEVQSNGGNYLQSGIADVTITNLEFPSGTRAHIFVSWLHPFKEHKLVVIGSEKMAVFDDTRSDDKLRIYDQGIDWVEGQPVPRKTAESVLFLPDKEPLKSECTHFIESIEKRTVPRTDGYNGIRVLDVLEASQESLEMGGLPVQVNRNLRRKFAHGA